MSVQLGSKYTGRPQAFIDTTSGTYWEVLPKVDADAVRIQRGILRHAASESLRQNSAKQPKN